MWGHLKSTSVQLLLEVMGANIPLGLASIIHSSGRAEPSKYSTGRDQRSTDLRNTVMKMTKPVAIVTGAGSGIGLAVATHLHSRGYRVIIADFNAETGEAAAKSLGDDAHFIHTDVANYASQARMFKQAYEWGGGRLDFCHANAGIDDRQMLYDGPEKEELDGEGLLKPLNTKSMQVNLEAVIQGLWLFKYYVGRSKEGGGGRG